MVEEALETLVGETSGRRGDLDRAREAFHARTGPFASGDPWHEERIQAFFDWYLCEWAAADLPDDALGRACRGAHRGLYRVTEVDDERAHLHEQIGGMRVRLPQLGVATRLRPDDRFDGRILIVDDTLRLAPGIVFHPASAHEALDELLAEVRSRELDRAEVLDGLLRMRMRLDRFTSIRARHLYRFEALPDLEILSAAWARHPSQEPT